MGLLISLSLIMFSGVFVSVALSQCNPAHSFSCGKWSNLTYPYWTKSPNQTDCNHDKYELYNCSATEFPSIYIQDQVLRVTDINLLNETMRLSLPIDGSCAPLNAKNRSQPLPPTLSPIFFSYGCHDEEHPPEFPGFQCGAHDRVYWGTRTYMPPPDTVNCEHHFYVMKGTTLDDIRSSTTMQKLLDNLLAALQSGIAVSISRSPSKEVEPRTGGSNIRLILVIGKLENDVVFLEYSETLTLTNPLNWWYTVFGVSGGTALIMSAFFVIYRRRRKAMYAHSSNYTRNVSFDPEKTGALYGVKFFTYDELKEATDNFSESRGIGDGGFGTVYLGTLKDGRIVAVKRLYENNCKKVEKFLNEVNILAHLHHKNLVTLYGCTSRHSRELLLVYEYISNGTVADHLHGENAQPEPLSWLTRLKIAVETANALTYLHASDIIHRDVKTSNILLDDHFNVKVADFGLSRLFPLDVTHVSTAPQGTPGYVDPEYHQCYQLTDKSDVYSFGVVLAELISSKPAVDITRHRHEINLSNMAMNKIQSGALNELVDPSLGFNKDSDVHKMITAVAELAFQCLQSDKDLRPSMKQVSEILTRIQCGDSQTMDKAEELDVFSDEFVLLENSPMPPLSPDIKAAQSVSSFKSFSSSSGSRNFIHWGQYKSY